MLLLTGCNFQKKLWVYVSFEYSSDEGGWFSGYIESSDGRYVDDVIVIIDSSYSFVYVDTLRKFINEYVFPNNEFDVSFEAEGFKKIDCQVKIPGGINLIQYDGSLSLSDNDGDTIIWDYIGDKPDKYRVMVYKGYQKIFDTYLTNTTVIIYPDNFTFSGDYTFYLLSVNYSDLNNADNGSIVAGVYRIRRTYTIINK